MSNAGQAVLSIGGAAIGFVIGGPAGAAWGFQLGSVAGSALFPTDLGTVSGPRLNDLNVQSSAIGAPIPIVYGTYAISGNVIWSSGIIETVKKKRQGGKGGPSQTVKTYSYKVNCAVGVCEGEISGIRRIWADAKLIYDAREQIDGETDDQFAARLAANEALLANTEIYLGTEDQLADPTIESFEGVGNISGFRGLAYVVFSEFQLEDYGNRVPNFRFEVSRQGLYPVSITEYSNEVLYPWVADSADPRASGNTHEYRQAAGGGGVWKTFDEARADWASTRGDPVGSKVYAWSIGNNTTEPTAPWVTSISTEYRIVRIWVNTIDVSTSNGPLAGANVCAVAPNFSGTVEWWCGKYDSPALWPHGLNTTTGGTPGIPWDSTIGCSPQPIFTNSDMDIEVKRSPGPPPSDENGAFTYDDSVVYKVLQKFNTVYSPSLTETVTKYPLSPALPIGHPSYSNQAFWESAYADAVLAGDMSGGLIYGVDYPVTQSYAYSRTFTSAVIDGSGGVPLSEIVREICSRCGLSDDQTDVSDLTEIVHGYVVSRVMSGRDAISPLRSFGFFDCVESDGILRWPARGKEAVAAIADYDLSAHEVSGPRPSAMEVDRSQTIELPRRLRLHYAQSQNNYEPGEQSASRLSAGTLEVRDMEVAVAMSDTKAAQIADVVLYDLWVSRSAHRLILDHSFLELEPADAITAPVDGRQERLRIVSIDHSLPGLLRLDAVRDDDGAYESYAIGAPAAYVGTGGATISIPGTADLVLLDLPLLRDADNDAGYYAAVQSVGGTSWGGAVIYRSPDGGTTYDQVSVADTEATIGTVVSALPSGPTTIIDEGNELVVEIESGELESVSDASLVAGLNAAAIGVDGRWEVIQFRDALFEDGSPAVWRLTGLLRGRRGTEWAVGSSQAGDRFVLLDSSLARVPSNLGAIGTERPHKAVLSGTTIEAATAVDFTSNAVALKPFSVVDVSGVWQDDGDLEITWIRRGRIGQELPSGTDIPLSEESESYEVDILSEDSPPTVLRTLTSISQTVTYTAAQQAADFGSPTPASVTVRIYQLSATVGRGYPAEAIL